MLSSLLGAIEQWLLEVLVMQVMYHRRSSVVVCHITNGNVGPACCVNKGEGRGTHVAYLAVVCHSWFGCCWLTPCEIGPASCVKEGKGEGSSSPEWTVMKTCVITVWTMCQVIVLCS